MDDIKFTPKARSIVGSHSASNQGSTFVTDISSTHVPEGEQISPTPDSTLPTTDVTIKGSVSPNYSLPSQRKSHKFIIYSLIFAGFLGVGASGYNFYLSKHNKKSSQNDASSSRYIGQSTPSKTGNSTTLGVSTANRSPEALLTNYQKQVSFPLYIPRTLPSGFAINSGSFKLSEGIVNFYIGTTTGQTITVAEQAKIPGFIAPSSYSLTSPLKFAPLKFTTNTGKATLFHSGDNSIALLETDKTLIICNVNLVSSEVAKTLLQAFKPL